MRKFFATMVWRVSDYIHTAPGRKATLLNPSSTARTRLEAKPRLWKKTGFIC